MVIMKALLKCASVLLVAAAALPAQGLEAGGVERIHIIGASVSGGFTDGPMFGAKAPGESVSLHRLLKRWCDGDAKVTTHPPIEMWMLFRDPAKTGQKEVLMAKRRKPDAVVAIDFLFWFVYGYVSGDPEAQRAAGLERGLALLDQLEVPLMVGDLPDMRGAANRMLKARQIPSVQVLKRLNRRLRSWAEQRGDVTLVPLAALVKELKHEGSELPLKTGALRTPPAALLQSDRLHATRLGMAFLVFRMQAALQGLFDLGHALHGQRWSFEEFVEAAGAEEELEDLQQRLASRRDR